MSDLFFQKLRTTLTCNKNYCSCQRFNEKGALVHCPAHEDKTPSLHLSVKEDTVLWHCHAGCSQEDVRIALEKRGLWRNGSMLSLQSTNNIQAIYDYLDEEGDRSFQVVRKANKSFLQRRPHPSEANSWIWGLTEGNYGQLTDSLDWYKVRPGKTYVRTNHFARCPLILYRLPEIIKSEVIYLVEGEKDVDTLKKHGIIATCNPGGAGKWRSEYNKYFKAKHVVILPDNDAEGQRHAQGIAEQLNNKAKSIKVINLPDLPKKGDVSDWLSQGNDKEVLEELVDQTEEWSPLVKEEIERTVEKRKQFLDEIEEYLQEIKGNFSIRELYNDFNLKTSEEKKNLRNKINYLVKSGFLERIGDRSGIYCRVDKNIEYLDYKDADMEECIDIYLPLGIHNYIKIPKQSVIIVAGVPNAGKTPVLFNIIQANMKQYPIVYLSSETTKQTMRNMILKYGDPPLNEWNFKMFHCESDWHHKIHRDMINIIDYLEFHDDFYKAGRYISNIHKALGSDGLAIIALQKEAGRDTGRGGLTTLEKPQLYISLNPGSATIVKAKQWGTTENPNGLVFKFKITEGIKLISTGERPFYRKLSL